MPSGRRPDLKRREQMLKLRASGLSLAQIGERLGINLHTPAEARVNFGEAEQEPGWVLSSGDLQKEQKAVERSRYAESLSEEREQ